MYAVVGFTYEVAFSALHDAVRRKPVRLRTSPWMLPVYALIRPLYDPLHDELRRREVPAPVRGLVYGCGFLAVEYASGTFFRRALGEAPWDYTYARRHVNGLIRPDYLPLWAAAGLGLEPLHDHLVRRPR